MAVKSLAQSSILQPTSTNSMLAGYESNYFHHLETVRLGATTAFVTLSNLERYSDYQHLQLRVLVNSNRNQFSNDPLGIQFNSDTGTNYSWHMLAGYNGSVSGNLQGINDTGIYMDRVCTTGNADIFGNAVIDILDAYETTKNKTIRCLSGNTLLPGVQLLSGSWRNTNAISSIKLFPAVSTFTSKTRISLYGIKARS